LEDALTLAEADTQETQHQIQAALVADTLELQLAEEHLTELEAAAPEVADSVHLMASAEEHLLAARQAVHAGRLAEGEEWLAKAKRGNADPLRMAEVEDALISAKQAKVVNDWVVRLNTNGEQPGSVSRIKRLIEEAQKEGVTELIAADADRALRSARRAANARYAQARPIAAHLAEEGYAPVIRDGRIEVWKAMTGKTHGAAAGHGATDQPRTAWTLDRIMVLRGGTWRTEKPSVPIVRQGWPKNARHDPKQLPAHDV
jgi:hypothetical protein